jgi:hypothetical protein
MKIIIPLEDAGKCKEKLMRLKEHLPQQTDETVCDFALYLAHQLKGSFSPQGFVTSCKSALYDLKLGVDLRTAKPIQNNLVGQLAHESPGDTFSEIIAEAVFPPEFARSVKEEIKSLAL